ncbi:MAG: XdhC family protein [Acidimicrobiales bacterium]|nr:XdhC family protein [Acidimicrobiales bacterium]
MSREIYAELLAAMQARRPVVLATVTDSRRSVPRRPGSKMLVYSDGTTSGTIGGGEMEARVRAEAADALAEGRPRRISYGLIDPSAGDPGVCGGEVELYLEPHMPQSTVYVIGLGHVGKAVIELASWLGHRVVGWDDRAEIADGIDDSADGVDIVSGDLADAVARFPIDEQTRVVMVTRHTGIDVDLLPVLLASPAPYIGLMGSRRRWANTRGKLEAAGLSADQLDRVVSPIGVEIAAETPAEIAVSILAQVIGDERGNANR